MKSQGHPIRAPLSVVGGTSSEKVKLKVGAGRYEPVTLVHLGWRWHLAERGLQILPSGILVLVQKSSEEPEAIDIYSETLFAPTTAQLHT